MNSESLPTISLFCTKGGSDKEYHATVIEVSGGYSVQTRYGRRGAAKIPKGELPVMTLEMAKKEFERLVKEKTSPAKGYTRDEYGTSYTDAETAGTFSGNLPHLLVPISIETLYELVYDDNYGFEQKIDGERLMIDRRQHEVVSSNKLGFVNTVPAQITNELLQSDHADILLDGESLNGQMHVFDILRLNGVCVKHLPMIERHRLLSEFVALKNLPKVPLYVGTEAKSAFLALAISGRAENLVEGVVAKQLDAPYSPGRATPSEATQFKFKFVDDASCVVMAVHPTKRSVAIGLLDQNGAMCEVGNVGIPVNSRMPDIDDIIDVQYRHKFEEGDLCEPVFLKHRSDILRNECMIGQVTRIKSRQSRNQVSTSMVD